MKKPPAGKLSRKKYEKQLRKLHVELVRLQEWVKHKGLKVCIVFEGRDTAGKGGTIKAITERVSPRAFRVIALPSPTEREKSQMYIQRYLPHLPAAGEVVIFDRSWYNRAGVERVMGFCTEEEVQTFLKAVPGVAGVDSIGGYAKTFVVEPDPTKLTSFGISYSELGEALERANLAVGANYYNRGGEAYLVRVDARVRSVDEIRGAVVATRGGVPVTVAQLAEVKIGGDLRAGAGSMNGKEAVIGTVLMLIGQNSRTVAEDVSAKIAQVSKTLPPGVEVKVVLDRAKLMALTNGSYGTPEGEYARLIEGA